MDKGQQAKMRLKPRQEQILQIITEQYIAAAVPVSSQLICDSFATPLSSATVRNECLRLEQLRLLEKPHTNSGRLPSATGYRYYIDHLMNPADDALSVKIKTRLTNIFKQRFRSVHQILNQASLIISEMMEVATVVTADDQLTTNQTLNHLQLIPLSERKALIVFVLNQRRVENKIFDVTGVKVDNLRLALDIFNARLRGTKIRDLLAKIELIKMILARQIYNYEQILLQLTNALINIGAVRTNQFGIKYMLQNPALHEVKINQLLGLVNAISPLTYFATHQPNANAATVFRLGSDLSRVKSNPITSEALKHIAVVSKSFPTESPADQATLSLVGDRRMAYGQIYNILG